MDSETTAGNDQTKLSLVFPNFPMSLTVARFSQVTFHDQSDAGHAEVEDLVPKPRWRPSSCSTAKLVATWVWVQDLLLLHVLHQIDHGT